MTAKKQRSLEKKIAEIKAVTRGERDLYPYIRDLLTRRDFGVELRPDQIVVDVAVAGGRDAPDLTVYGTKGGKALKTPDHAVAVFEVKKGGALKRDHDAIYQEKKKYIQPGTRHFFLMDQERVIRHDLPPLVATHEFELDDLADPDTFARCFGVLSPDSLALEAQLAAFQANQTDYAYQSIDQIGRHHFISTIREVAGLLNEAVSSLIDRKVVPDLREATAAIDRMRADWGEPRFAWEENGHPVEFEKMLDDESLAALSQEDVARYEEEHDLFAARVEPYLYALRIEHQLLKDYAVRMSIESENLSLLAPRKQGSKLTDSGRAVESFAYETASLIVSRMLMVRFSEDHDFLKRCISNGGVQVFAEYARYYRKPMQALLKETYVQSRDLYRNLFDAGLLDWALDSDDAILSDALLHSMYLLSRWDFRTIHGDILSGVYDHYLDTGKRRALGEVFTRPEIARYMLERCQYGPTKTVLDPACGTGTFLVEALNQDVRRLRSAGMLTEKTVIRTLERLHGLDLSMFSVFLAQIQLLWHNIDLFTGKSAAEIRALAAALVPAIQVQGGRSSLDTLGVPLIHGDDTVASQTGLDFSVVASELRRKRVASVPRRFRQIVQGTYDIVIGNPPYVRPHRMAHDEATLRAYDEVSQGQVDLYILFLYRAVRGWVKDGGRVAFIVPMGVLDSAYAGLLRRVLSEFKLVEIVDMEALKKKTFRGIKRPTVIFVLENSPGSEAEEVATTTLSMTCYDAATDTIDFGKADRSSVKRSRISQSSYLPTDVGKAPWMDEVAGEGTAALLTKVSSADADVLERMAQAPRLGSIIKVVYKRRGKKKVGAAQADAVEQIPAGDSPLKWEPYVMLAYGIKMGGSRALAPSGLPIFKGQNIFPSRVLGEPIGYWNPESSVVDSLRLHAYRHLFDHSRLYAFRNVSQLPAACPAPAGLVFQNTAQLVQLAEDFPLNLYLLSRIPQWFAAKLLRSSIIEDLFTTWVKRNLLLIPIPPRRTPSDVALLSDAGELVVTRDKDLANAHRHVEQLIADSPKKSLFDLFAEGDPLVVGADLTGAMSADSVTAIHEEGEELVSDELFFRIRVPNPTLRRYLAYRLERMLDEDEEVTLDVETMGNMQVPTDIEAVVAAINLMRNTDPSRMFQEAQMELDRVVARLFGMSQEDLDYITSAMMNDGFLKQLRPNYEHRGLRVQPYADHSAGDRYS